MHNSTKKEPIQAIKKGFTWLVNEIEKQKKEGTIYLPSLEQLSDSSNFLYRALNEIDKRIPKMFLDQKEIKFGDGRILVRTPRVKNKISNGPVLAIYPTKKILDDLDSDYIESDIFVISWVESELEEWKKRWSAKNYLTNEISSMKSEMSPKLIKALEKLHLLVNSTTGITHSSDKRTAIKLFKQLLKDGIDYMPQNIKNWLISKKKWKARHAEDVKQLAKNIKNEKRQ